MKLHVLKGVVATTLRALVLLVAVLGGVEAKNPDRQLNFEASCTTTPKIYFTKEMRIPEFVDPEEAREAIITSLGFSSTNANWGQENFKGQWYFEHADGNVIYAGLTIRSHYLQLAINYDEEKVTTIVCDSENLRQRNRSIHRKVPLWKAKLDSKIRMELGHASEYDRINDEPDIDGLVELQRLHDLGVLTELEFVAIGARLKGESSFDFKARSSNEPQSD